MSSSPPPSSLLLSSSPLFIAPKPSKLIDQLYDKAGYSAYQKLQVFIACLINIVIGVESLLLNLIVVQLEHEWQIRSVHTATLVASFGVGTGIGGYLSGYLADNLGRKKVLLYSLMTMIVFGLASVYVKDFYVFLVFRVFVSIGVGIVKMIVTSYLVEWIPKKNRSFVMSITQVYSVGNIIINLSALLCIENNKLVHWRYLFIGSSSLTILSILLLAVFSQESPKFHLSKMNFEEAFKSLTKIHKHPLTELEKNIIKAEIAVEESHQIKTSVSVMFTPLFLKASLLLIGIRVFSSLINAGSLYILPILLGKLHIKDAQPNDKSADHTFNQYDAIFGYFISNLIAVPSPMLRGFLSELKILGRKYTLFLSCVLGLIAIILCLIFFDLLSLFSGISRMAFTATTGLLNIYIVEIFPTKIRTLSLGFINSITRIGPVLAPFICSALEGYMIMGSFYFFGVIAFICCVLNLLLPYETRDLDMDNMEELRRGFHRSESSSSIEIHIQERT